MRFILLVVLAGLSHFSHSQNIDSLKMAIKDLQIEQDDINLRMNASQKQFQTGILVSTLGYSITIAGGLMLGRENDQVGQALLVLGGATGITGTYILMDSFRVLSGKRRKKRMERFRN